MSNFISFEDFHISVHGYQPYEWQKDLAAQVGETKVFPDQICVPTGMGKTSTLDVAVWALAKDVHDNGVEGRTFPQRIFMTVDRRLVVDGAHQYALVIKDAIDNNAELVIVKDSLSMLLVDEIDSPVIRVTSMHGGKKFSRDWLTPVGCQIITSTVAQFGSRLLFRGIGVSNGSLPINAGIVGMDSIVLMDEPHLTPVASLVTRECSEIQGDRKGMPPKLQSVLLGATIPPEVQDRSVQMNVFAPDLSLETSEEAQRRLSPRRPVQIVETEDKTDKVMLNLAFDVINDLSTKPVEDRGDGVLISCNTIKKAQSIALSLQKKYKSSEWRVQLITSTIRPYTREAEHYFDGNTITVATQTIEVGVDINCCALITEMAGLSALIQRVGRLNRNGKISDAQGFIVGKVKYDEIFKEKIFAPDAAEILIYDKDALDEAWRALHNCADDLGVIRKMPDISEYPDAWPPMARTVPLKPYMKAMTMTQPRVDFPWDFFLYGDKDHERREVEVAWREELEVLDDVTVMNPEKIVVPLSDVRDFVKSCQKGNDDVPVYHFINGEWKKVEKYYHIKPDSVVVLHSSLGGYSDSEGWIGVNTKKTVRVEDISHKVACYSGEGKFSLNRLFTQEEIEDFEENGTLKKAIQDHPVVNGRSFVVQKGIVKIGDFTNSVRVKGDSVLLADHAEQTRRLAEKISVRSGWGEYSSLISEAALHHDDGKVTKEFQGQMGNLDLSNPLAKSGLSYRSFSAPPVGWRHEVLSAKSTDNPLVRHLILSHHGWGRPMVRHADEILDMSEEFNFSHDELGVWGTALAEANLRISDWEASANPERVGRAWVPPVLKEVFSRASVDGMLVNEITGVNRHSMSSMLSSLGALLSAVKSGDENAMIRFPQGAYPQVATSSPIQWNSELWRDTFDAIGSLICNSSGDVLGLTGKNSKWNYAVKNYDGFNEEANFLTYSADSFLEKTGDKAIFANLSSLLFPNNSTYFADVVDVDAKRATDSLFDFDAGCVLDHRVWGGIDYLAGRINSGFDAGQYVNAGIRPWVILGVLALGMPCNRYGAGIVGRKDFLLLPRPDDWVTLEQYRNLVLSRLSRSWVYESKPQESSEKMKMWVRIADETLDDMFDIVD